MKSAGEMIFFLHGFPQTTAMWNQIVDLLPDDHICHKLALPGYEPHSLQRRPENYSAKAIADELAGKIKQLNGGRPATIVGHDIGAFIAYTLAFDHPNLVRALVVINGVHPQLYQSALVTDPKQAEAGKYISFLRSQDAEAELSRNRFKLLLQTHNAVTEGIRVLGEEAEVLIELWSQPGVLSAMLEFYRASDIRLPSPKEMSEDLVPSPTTMCRIAQPHLLIWGKNDPYLLPSSIAGLGALCNELTIINVDDAGHGIVCSHPELVASEITKFLAGVE